MKLTYIGPACTGGWGSHVSSILAPLPTVNTFQQFCQSCTGQSTVVAKRSMGLRELLYKPTVCLSAVMLASKWTGSFLRAAVIVDTGAWPCVPRTGGVQ